jgi:phytoene dehydrogenase-like protein
MAEQFDVVVAGGGHNSLTCAAYLAKAGLSVLVLEARPIAGGDTVTEELTLPGFWHDTCSSAHVLFQSSPVFRNNELELDRYGLSYIYPDPVVTLPFPDGSSLTMWRDIQRTAAEFARFSRRDADAYLRMMADYDAVKKVFGQVRFTPVGYGPAQDEALLARPDGPLWVRRTKQSAWEIIEQNFEHDHTRAFMLWLAFMTLQAVDLPGTGRNAYAVANGRQNYSWTTPVGGSGMLAKALVANLEEHGGVVLTGQRVVELVLENGRCTGVVTAGGETYRAKKAVVSTIHIKHLVDMAPKAAWGDLFVQGVEQWQPGYTMFVAHYALSEPPRYPLGENGQPVVAAGIPESSDNMLALMGDFRRGLLHQDEPVLLVICSSLVDESRTPPGKHTLKVISFFPYQLAGHAPEYWDEIKKEVADRNMEHLRRYAPNLSADVVLGEYIESPLDLERYNAHNWRGSCHGGAATPSQSGSLRPVPGWASHRMPLPGLYQTGATTHPGGSVTGGPGRNAAWVLLDDLGIPFESVLARQGEPRHA